MVSRCQATSTPRLGMACILPLLHLLLCNCAFPSRTCPSCVSLSYVSLVCVPRTFPSYLPLERSLLVPRTFPFVSLVCAFRVSLVCFSRTCPSYMPLVRFHRSCLSYVSLYVPLMHATRSCLRRFSRHMQPGESQLRSNIIVGGRCKALSFWTNLGDLLRSANRQSARLLGLVCTFSCDQTVLTPL